MGSVDDNQDPETLDQQCEPSNRDPTLSDEDVASSRSVTMYGPHPKLSGDEGDEIYNVQPGADPDRCQRCECICQN
jgi:hypothetical protein